MLALAADHVVRDTAAFIAACRKGLVAADAGRIVTFGIKPERAATEYGYISPGEMVSGEVRAVAKFVEKPDQATAADYSVWLSLEQRQLHVPRLVLLDEYRKFDAAASRRSPMPWRRLGAISALSRSTRMPSVRPRRSRSTMR